MSNMSWSSIKKTCDICKKTIDLEIDDVVYEKQKGKDKFSHFKCLVAKKLQNKRNKQSVESIEIKLKEIQSNNYGTIKNIILKEKMCKWIQENYRIVALPSYIFLKLESIYNGTYKGLSKGIPVEDLLDMWAKKKNELDKIADRKIKKDNSLNDLSRVSYDLAILVGWYDSYLGWKEKNKILEFERNRINQETQQTQQINYQSINKLVDKNKNKENSNNEEININDLLDELF